MADLVGTTIARNYLKAVETSKMGTRELAVVVVDMNTDVTTDYTDSNSLFAQAVRSLQTVVEMYAVFAPSGNIFTMLVAADTLPQDEGESAGDGNRISGVSTVVSDATGESVDVWNASIDGDNINYD